MNLNSSSPTAWHRARLVSWTAALAAASCAASASIIVLDFENIPNDYQDSGTGLNLGVYYAGQPGGPVFGPEANVLGGTTEYPPASGISVLFSPSEDHIQVAFASPVAAVSVYYRANTDLYLYAYDSADVLLGSVSGPDNLAPDGPPQFLAFDTGLFNIARVSIQGAGAFFVIDDFTYNVVPEPHQYALIAGLGLAAFAAWRRRS